MRISDWSSDVCSSDLPVRPGAGVMFQQPAITDNLTAGRAHPPAADASAEDTSPAERDPFLHHYFRRIAPRVAPSFRPEQRHPLTAMFGAPALARPPVATRPPLPPAHAPHPPLPPP